MTLKMKTLADMLRGDKTYEQLAQEMGISHKKLHNLCYGTANMQVVDLEPLGRFAEREDVGHGLLDLIEASYRTRVDRFERQRKNTEEAYMVLRTLAKHQLQTGNSAMVPPDDLKDL
jgi:hypothetical protein